MTSIAIDRTDGLSSAAAIKGPCRVATTANITLSGEQTIDGVAVVADDRVLVKNQTTGSENGIYVVDTGSWRRSKDFNKTRDVVTGTLAYVTSGTTNAQTQWVVTTTGTIVIGTTSITFSNDAPVPGDGTVTTAKIVNDAVTNAKLANMTEATIKGRISTGSGDPEDLTPTQARSVLDYLRGFNADGTTDDTANFTTLRAAYPSRRIDLYGSTYLITALPTGPFVNGYWVKANADGAATVRYMARETLPMLDVAVSDASFDYKSWPQDNTHEYGGVVWLPFSQGSGHNSVDQKVYLRASFDGGKSWPLEEEIQTGYSNSSAMIFGAGVVDGQQILIIRQGPNGGGDGAQQHRIYARRLEQRRDQTISYDIETTNGSPTVKVKKQGGGTSDFGVKVGDRVSFSQASGAANGVTLSGILAVVDVFSDGFTVTESMNATSTGTATITVGLEFLQDAFAELQFSAVSFGSAIVTAASYSGQPTILHGLAPIGGGLGGFYSGVSINESGNKCDVVKVLNILKSTRSISYVRRVSSNANLVEPTVCRDPATGNLFGGLRTQSSATPMAFWFTTDDLATAATVFNGPGSGFAVASPVPLRLDDGVLHGCLTGARVPGSGAQADYVPVYWLRIPVADFLSSNASAAIYTKASEAYFANMNISDGGNAVGVPSLCVLDMGTTKRLVLAYSTENYPIVKDLDGQPSIRATLIDIETDGTELGGFRSLKTPPQPGRIMPTKWPRQPVVLTAIMAAAGTSSFARGLATVKTATGRYDVTFVDADGVAVVLGHTEFTYAITCTAANNTIQVFSVGGDGFSIATKTDAGVDQDTALNINVFVWNDVDNVT